MKEETTPEPLRASATLTGGLTGSISGTATLGPKPKPPWLRWFVDQNWGLAKLLLKGLWWVGSIGSAFGGWQTIWDTLQPFFGRRRQPAQT